MRGGREGSEWGLIPTWWTPAAKRKVLEGLFTVRPNGKVSAVGGHKSGRGWAGKSEFPPHWDDAQVDKALVLAWNDPDAWVVRDGRRTVRRVVDGVMVEVSAYGEDFGVFRSYYPMGGDGVIFNDRAEGPIQVPLDLSRLSEEGWRLR